MKWTTMEKKRRRRIVVHSMDFKGEALQKKRILTSANGICEKAPVVVKW